MRRVSVWMFAVSALALGACSSNSPAPLVYGTQPTSTGRIYNSPSDSSKVNAPVRPVRAASTAPARQAGASPAPLTPVDATLIEANYEAELPPAPTYISLQDAPAQSASRGTKVTVRAGDTVYAIARRTGVSPEAIIRENSLRSPYRLEIGDQLQIPGAQAKIVNSIARPAPARTASASTRIHQVRAGDTLYSISRSTGASVKEIAQVNGLRKPYTLEIGDRLRIPPASGGAHAASAPSGEVEQLARSVSYAQPEPVRPSRMFEWPVKGAIISEFGSGGLGRNNDGVNIAAPIGTPVRAAADGEVVYRGSELEGYGNLLLIKHDDGFVTAYAHNDVMLVKKGQKVNQGHVIAKVGKTGAVSEPQLHFEIRQNLKSVDPIAFLDN